MQRRTILPVGFAIAKALGLHRNPYVKIGHFAQGLVPAIAAREVLVRGRYISSLQRIRSARR